MYTRTFIILACLTYLQDMGIFINLIHSTYDFFSNFQPEEFWKHIANNTVEWIQPFTQVMNCNMTEARFEWFSDGTLNASGNNITTHLDFFKKNFKKCFF